MFPFNVSTQESYPPLHAYSRKLPGAPRRVSLTPKNVVGDSSLRHRLVATENNKLKNCLYCQYHKVTTKSGWRVSTRHKCEVCDVALCKGRRCFELYHNTVFQAPVSEGITTNTQPDISNTQDDKDYSVPLV